MWRVIFFQDCKGIKGWNIHNARRCQNTNFEGFFFYIIKEDVFFAKNGREYIKVRGFQVALKRMICQIRISVSFPQWLSSLTFGWVQTLIKLFFSFLFSSPSLEVNLSFSSPKLSRNGYRVKPDKRYFYSTDMKK